MGNAFSMSPFAFETAVPLHRGLIAIEVADQFVEERGCDETHFDRPAGNETDVTASCFGFGCREHPGVRDRRPMGDD
jgi:hypothetical protein